MQAPNATHAINTVLWNIKWEAGDIILLCKSRTRWVDRLPRAKNRTDRPTSSSFLSSPPSSPPPPSHFLFFLFTSVTTQYGAIFNTAAHIADVNPGVTLLEIPLHFPTTHSEIVRLVKETVAKVKKDEKKTGSKIKLSVVEAISSIPGG